MAVDSTEKDRGNPFHVLCVYPGLHAGVGSVLSCVRVEDQKSGKSDTGALTNDVPQKRLTLSDEGQTTGLN